MKYFHAKLEFNSDRHYWWNMDEESMRDRLLLPFINGHVVVVSRNEEQKLLNMKNVTLLVVYKTDSELKSTDEKSIFDQINHDSFSENECTEESLNNAIIDQSSEASSSLIQKSLASPKKQVFVIMKFGDAMLDSAYEGVYEPVCNEFGLECIRIDKIEDSGKISDQILTAIAESKYVIADLTGNRPNCYYECGFAHALGKELILTNNKTDDVHFDLAGYRFIQWETESDLRRKFKKRLKTLENV